MGLKKIGDVHPSKANMTTLDDLEYCLACKYPLSDGPCLNCEDKKEKDIEAAYRESERLINALGGLRAYKTFTFDQFSKTKINTPTFDAMHLFDPAKDNAFLWGPAGTGKTHLATAAVRGHKGAEVVKATGLLALVRAGMLGATFADGQTVMDSYCTHPILVIDDLGAEKDTEFAVTTLLTIIDRRWMDMRNGLIVTSNMPPNELSEKLGDDRIVSRLAGMCKFYSLAGERDMRVAK